MTAGAALHVVLHFVVPALVAKLARPRRWLRAWLIMVATLAMDLDHLLATPLYDPDRCSIGTHVLHTWPAALVYAGLAAHPKTRIAGWGFLIHLALDGVDCLRMRW